MSSWSLRPILDSYPAVALLALLMLLTLLLPLFRRLSLKRRLVLATLRGLVILLIVAAMLRPTLISTSTRPQTALLLVLFDQSRSMQLPDAGSERSRWQAQEMALRQIEPKLAAMSENLLVKVYGYDAQLHPAEAVEGRLSLPERPTGEQTDIGSVLMEAMQREAGTQLAGVVLLGDGAQTAWDPEVEVLQAGREIARLGSPLYTVAFGPAGDRAQARDVAVDNLPEKYTAFVKNELVVRGFLRINGYVNQEVTVELVVDSPDGSQQVLGPVRVVARTDGQQIPVEMTYVPEQAGQYKLTLRAAPKPGELVTKNNQLSAFLTVLDGGLKVLYLEGDYRNEVRFLLRSLEASPDIRVEFDILEKSGRRNWPVDLGRVFQDREYDAFILGDLDAAALGNENLEQLAKAVEGGKGLAMLGGLHSFGPGGYRDTPLANVLPITMGRFERQDFDGEFRADLHYEGPLRLLPTRSHPIMQLAAKSANRAAWERLPPLQGANRFQGLKDSPSTQVIGESQTGVPLLVASEYVDGRVLAMAADSTWLWVMKGFAKDHKRFWRQAVLWLARRDDLQQNDVWVKLDQRRHRVGVRVELTAGARSPAGDVVEGAELFAEWVLPDGTRRAVPLAAEGEQFVGAIDSVQEAGDHRVEIRAQLGATLLGTARASFQVLDEDVELSNPAADPDQLARLSRLTESFGGRVVPAEQLAQLMQSLADQPPEVKVQVQNKWQPGSTTLDAWILLLILAVLLAGEWALRKQWGLV